LYGRNYSMKNLGFGPPVTPPVIKKLILLNAGVFVAQMILGGGGQLELGVVEQFGAVWPYRVWQHGWIWQPFTYMFLHAPGFFGHILMNMFALWMFGSPLAMAWGAKRFLRYYLVCGFGAGILIATYPYLLNLVGIPQNLSVPTLGASGAVYGVLLGYSLTWPDRTIMLIFPPVAFRAIWLIPVLFFLTYAFGSGNVSHVGHLGGVLVGWLWLRRQGRTAHVLPSLSQLRYRWSRWRMRRRLQSIRREESRPLHTPWDDDHTLH